MLGVISILVSIACGFIIWRGLKSSVFGDAIGTIKDSMKAEDLRFVDTGDKVDNRVLLKSLQTYIDAIRTNSPRRLHNIMTDALYHTTQVKVEGMTRIGLRREIEYEHTGVMEPASIMQDGKITWAQLWVPCKYTERLVDSTTGAVLETTQIDNANIVLDITRNPDREPGEEINCLGCGNPIDSDGELFICKYCKATYTADSYDWSIAGYDVYKGWGTSKSLGVNPLLTGIVSVMMGLMVFNPILGFIAGGNSALTPVVWILNIITLGAVFFYVYWLIPHAMKGFIELKKIDPLSSLMQLHNRTEYLLSIFFSAMSFSPRILKPFIEPSIYEEISQNFKPTGNYVLNVEGAGWGTMSGAIKHEGKIYFNYSIDFFLTVFDSSRRLNKIKKKLNFQLCRGENVVTENKGGPEALVCPGCGKTINLTADGRCKYCKTEYDLSQVDWILGRVSDDMFV